MMYTSRLLEYISSNNLATIIRTRSSCRLRLFSLRCAWFWEFKIARMSSEMFSELNVFCRCSNYLWLDSISIWNNFYCLSRWNSVESVMFVSHIKIPSSDTCELMMQFNKYVKENNGKTRKRITYGW